MSEVKHLYRITNLDMETHETYDIVKETPRYYYIIDYYSYDSDKEKAISKDYIDNIWVSEAYTQMWFTNINKLDSHKLQTAFYSKGLYQEKIEQIDEEIKLLQEKQEKHKKAVEYYNNYWKENFDTVSQNYSNWVNEETKGEQND